MANKLYGPTELVNRLENVGLESVITSCDVVAPLAYDQSKLQSVIDKLNDAIDLQNNVLTKLKGE